jgi:hypothetical protein
MLTWKIEIVMVILKYWQLFSTWKLKHLPFFYCWSNLRTRGKTQSTYKRKDTIYVQEKRHNLGTRGKTQSTYKRKDTIYAQEERHNLRTRGKKQSTYKKKLLNQDYILFGWRHRYKNSRVVCYEISISQVAMDLFPCT